MYYWLSCSKAVLRKASSYFTYTESLQGMPSEMKFVCHKCLWSTSGHWCKQYFNLSILKILGSLLSQQVLGDEAGSHCTSKGRHGAIVHDMSDFVRFPLAWIAIVAITVLIWYRKCVNRFLARICFLIKFRFLLKFPVPQF